MAEGRMLKKEISDSKKLGELKSDRPRVVYLMMLPHLDIKGRLKADPQKIKGQILTMLPYSVGSIQRALEALHNVNLILLYNNNGEQLLEYTRFADFQSLNANKEAESKIPDPTPEDSSELQSTLPKVKISKDKLSKDNMRKSSKPYSPEFLSFWKKFIGRWITDKSCYDKGSKREAFDEWEKLSIPEQRLAWRAAKRAGGKYTPDACRWLKQKRWEK